MESKMMKAILVIYVVGFFVMFFLASIYEDPASKVSRSISGQRSAAPVIAIFWPLTAVPFLFSAIRMRIWMRKARLARENEIDDVPSRQELLDLISAAKKNTTDS